MPSEQREPEMQTAGAGVPVREEPFLFENHGQNLVGILALPEGAAVPRTGLVTLGGWSGYRIGAHGILTDFSRRAAAEGFACLRFDFRGRGDSEGEMQEASRASMIDDALRAMQVLRERVGCERVVLLGMCAGSQVAIGATAAGANPDALVLWSAPVSEQAEEEKAVASKRRHFLKDYAAKLLRPQTWRKLITGKLQPRKIAQVLSGQAGRADADDRTVDLRAAARLADFPAPLLFLYGTNDPVTPVALPYYRRILQARATQVSVEMIEGANHSFYGTEWKEQVLARTLEWLRRQT